MRSTNPILIDFAIALLRNHGLAPEIFDQHMSLVEGSLGVLPRRVMIADAEEAPARKTLTEAGLGHELAPEKDVSA